MFSYVCAPDISGQETLAFILTQWIYHVTPPCQFSNFNNTDDRSFYLRRCETGRNGYWDQVKDTISLTWSSKFSWFFSES